MGRGYRGKLCDGRGRRCKDRGGRCEGVAKPGLGMGTGMGISTVSSSEYLEAEVSFGLMAVGGGWLARCG